MKKPRESRQSRFRKFHGMDYAEWEGTADAIREVARLSEPSFARVWDNEEDEIYNDLEKKRAASPKVSGPKSACVEDADAV